MKPINSAIIGVVGQARRAANSIGSELGETGFAGPLPTSSRPDRGTAIARPRRSTLPQSVFSMPSRLWEVKQVTLGVTQDGDRITAMVLATTADLADLKSSIETIRRELAPAEPREIAAELARLFSHYPSQSSGNNITVAEDWIEDMGEVSAKGFREAVRRWRREPHAFKPSPGQLLELIETIEEPIRERLEALEEVAIETERMSPAIRITHMRQWLYELELGMVPYEVHMKGYDEVERYLVSEKATIRAEIERLQEAETV